MWALLGHARFLILAHLNGAAQARGVVSGGHHGQRPSIVTRIAGWDASCLYRVEKIAEVHSRRLSKGINRVSSDYPGAISHLQDRLSPLREPPLNKWASVASTNTGLQFDAAPDGSMNRSGSVQTRECQTRNKASAAASLATPLPLLASDEKSARRGDRAAAQIPGLRPIASQQSESSCKETGC